MAAALIRSGLTFPMRGDRVSVVSTVDGIVVRDRGGAEIGTVELERMDGNILFIKTLCIEEARRGYGAGTETAQLLLTSATGKATAVRAWAPPDLGLAVYFWIRMGLRPLHGEGPDGGIWFERAL